MRTDIRIARGVHAWTQQELVVGSEKVQRLYNNYYSMLDDLSSTTDDQRNTAARKAHSHASRFINNGAWYLPFELNPADDDTAAKMLFASFMRVSGARKNLACTLTDDQESFDEYIRDERNFAHGRLVVAQGMSEAKDGTDFSILRRINERTMRNTERVFEVIKAEGGVFSPDAQAAAREFETDALRTLATYVMFSAQARGGDITAVPALEPKSISLDPAIIYPFAQAA